MSQFKQFKADILSLPGVWKNESRIYFAQTRDYYTAAYKPNYPKGSAHDMCINTIDRTGAYLRGNLELVIYLENKFTALYFQDIEQLRDFFGEGPKQVSEILNY